MKNMNGAVSTLSPQVYVQLPPDLEAHLQPPPSTNLEDVHICGTCKNNFSDINLFIEHKRTGCLSSPQKKATAMAPSITQSAMSYLATATSGSEDGVSILGPPYLRVILDGGSLAVSQSSEPSQQDCGGNQESQILRSRLLGQHQVAVSVPPSYNGSTEDVQTIVLHQPQQQQQQEQQQQPQQHSRREFHIDEEDVATLLANQFTNEAVNAVHGASISTSRAELLGLENEIIIPAKRDGLDLASISLSEGDSGSLMLDNSHKQGQDAKQRTKISVRSMLGNTSTAAHDMVGARDKFWGQSNSELEVCRQTTSNVLSTENTETTAVSINVPSPARGKKKHDCPVAGCPFATCYVKDLVRHMRKHTGERPFQCNACQRTFSRGDKLQMHLRIHSGEKPHRCQQCDYATIDSGSLRKHMRIHNDERPFKCQICPYRSRDTSQLTVHLRTHTGDNPFVCPYETCPSAFKTSSDLKRHARMHTGEKPFSCEMCNYRCAIKSNLRVHVRLNHVEVKTIQCMSCDYVATSKRDAKEHEKIHAEEVLKCAICSYSCMNSAGMRSHLKVHTVDKPFACKLCSYTCRQLSNLKSHTKKKHPDTRASKKGKGSAKETSTAAKGSTPSRISGSKSYVHSKPFCVKSHQCTFCEAAFVREDSWRSHMRQHQNQDSLHTRQSGSVEAEDRGSTAVEILSKAAAEVGAACDQERAVAMMTSEDVHVQGDLLETESFLSIQLNEEASKSDGYGQNESHNDNTLDLESKVPNNSDSFIRSTEDEKNSKEQQIVQQSAKQEIMDANALQAQPILLYLQNAPVVDSTVGDSLRSAEILASLNQTGSILVAGRCGQYLSLPVDQNNSLMEQLAASLQPGMQYILSGPLEGMVGTETAFIQAGPDIATSSSSDASAVPLQSIISVQVDKSSVVSEDH